MKKKAPAVPVLCGCELRRIRSPSRCPPAAPPGNWWISWKRQKCVQGMQLGSVHSDGQWRSRAQGWMDAVNKRTR